MFASLTNPQSTEAILCSSSDGTDWQVSVVEELASDYISSLTFVGGYFIAELGLPGIYWSEDLKTWNSGTVINGFTLLQYLFESDEGDAMAVAYWSGPSEYKYVIDCCTKPS